MIDIEVAAWSLVHDFPGGAPALGAMAGIDSTLLSNKVNPNNDRNKLMLKEAERIQMVSGDHRILHAMAANLGEVCVSLPTAATDEDLTHATLKSMRAVGALMGEIDDATNDNKITPNELKRIQHAMLESVAHITALYSLLSSQSGR